jgi:hypothetical protein
MTKRTIATQTLRGLIAIFLLNLNLAHAADEKSVSLEITAGEIEVGTITEATLDTETSLESPFSYGPISKQSGPISLKKGDKLTGGTIKSGEIRGTLTNIPIDYTVQSDTVVALSNGKLTKTTIKNAKISNAVIDGKSLNDDITVDIVEADISGAKVKSLSIPLQKLVSASISSKALLIGGIVDAKSSPPDISGRSITLNQNDSQYSAFTDVKSGEKKICGQNCAYIVKADDNKDLLVNISKLGADATVELGRDYRINKEIHQVLRYAYSGPTFGILAVPFKWQTSDKSLGGSTSIGAYVGFQTGTSIGGYGFNMIPLISLGLTNLTVQNQTNSSDTSTVTGFTAALGLGFSVSKSQSSLQGGLVCGQDRAGTSTPTPYKYEGEWWCSIELGFPFAQ